MPARIAGVLLPQKKQIAYAITAIYGIGHARALRLLKETGIEPKKKTFELSEDEIGKLRSLIEKSFKVEGELKRERIMNIRRLQEIGTYRGSRHAKNLPVRGQRTKTNSRTVRGNVRRTMGSGRRPAAEKT